jgi:pimeloyl-ACP methyl ester carboxylesterase
VSGSRDDGDRALWLVGLDACRNDETLERSPAMTTIRKPRRVQLEVGGGRTLEVLIAGEDGALPLVCHLGTPSAAVERPRLTAPALARGLQLVAFSRPGYSTSSAQRGRTVADNVANTEAVLGHLGIREFLSIGWSGGGPHALADGALLVDRCQAAAIVAGVAPYGVEGLDWTSGMGPENLEEFARSLEGADALEPFLDGAASALADVQGPDVAAALGGLVSDVDKAALTPEFAGWLASTMRAAVSTGVAGWRDDDLAFVRPWGFEIGDVRIPVAVWQGDSDLMVPLSHGEWLAAHLPYARPHLVENEGHLSLFASIESVLDDLVAIARNSGS